MRVRVRLFSLLRERAGRAQEDLELAAGATVQDALVALEREHPGLGPLFSGAAPLPVLFAVNREYASPSVALCEGDEVAVFPPVSGGSDLRKEERTASGPETGDPAAHPLRHGLLLLSGGFDSPVAGHIVQSGGRRIEAVHFTMEPFTDDASARKARDLARLLRLERLTIVPLGEDLAEFTRRCDHRFYFVLLKRLMLRVAEALARPRGCDFLVTGENLGQVSSQTLPNLGVIDAAATLPVLRPLLGLDKIEIIRMAERIGTFEMSRGPELCDLLGPRHPATGATLAQIEAEERKLDIRALVENAVSKATDAPVGAEISTAAPPASSPGRR